MPISQRMLASLLLLSLLLLPIADHGVVRLFERIATESGLRYADFRHRQVMAMLDEWRVIERWKRVGRLVAMDWPLRQADGPARLALMREMQLNLLCPLAATRTPSDCQALDPDRLEPVSPAELLGPHATRLPLLAR